MNLEGCEGVTFEGFVQPAELPAVMRRAACLVLPSLSEAWGVVVHEATSCGLHVIASEAVGAADDLVRDGVNGRVCATGDSEALADCFVWMHNRNPDDARSGVTISHQLASAFSPSRWVESITRLAMTSTATKSDWRLRYIKP